MSGPVLALEWHPPFGVKPWFTSPWKLRDGVWSRIVVVEYVGWFFRRRAQVVLLGPVVPAARTVWGNE